MSRDFDGRKGTPRNVFISFEPFNDIRVDDDLNLNMRLRHEIVRLYNQLQGAGIYPELKTEREEESKYNVESNSLSQRMNKLRSIENPCAWIFFQCSLLCPNNNSNLEKELKIAEEVSIFNRRLFLADYSLLDRSRVEYDKGREEVVRKTYEKRFVEVGYFDLN